MGIVVKRGYSHKIDPIMRDAIVLTSVSPKKVIVLATKYKKCKHALKQMNIKILDVLPLVNGYIVELPANRLKKLAGYKCVRYIAANTEIKSMLNKVDI